MKNNVLVVFISVIAGVNLFGFGVSMTIAQSKENFQETVKVDTRDICSGYFYEQPEIETGGIFLCKDKYSKDDQIYVVPLMAEDVGELYFDSNRNIIAHCGMNADDPYPGKCKDIRLKYSCDKTRNLRPQLCVKEYSQSYTACGCGCCGGVDPNPIQKCLYHSRGEDLREIMKSDEAQRLSPDCKFIGCARGTKYTYCD